MSDELVRLDLAWGAVTRLQADLDAAVAEHIRVWKDTRECVNKYDAENARLRAENERLRAALQLGVQMRVAQAAYFKQRNKDTLIASKTVEADFDKAARAALGDTHE